MFPESTKHWWPLCSQYASSCLKIHYHHNCVVMRLKPGKEPSPFAVALPMQMSKYYRHLTWRWLHASWLRAELDWKGLPGYHQRASYQLLLHLHVGYKLQLRRWSMCQISLAFFPLRIFKTALLSKQTFCTHRRTDIQRKIPYKTYVINRYVRTMVCVLHDFLSKYVLFYHRSHYY